MPVANSDIGQRIRFVRQKVGLTQPELGEQLGVEKAAISKYEAGEAKRGVPIEFLAKIAELGNVTLDWLITGREPARTVQAPAVTTAQEVRGEPLSQEEQHVITMLRRIAPEARQKVVGDLTGHYIEAMEAPLDKKEAGNG